MADARRGRVVAVDDARPGAVADGAAAVGAVPDGGLRRPPASAVAGARPAERPAARSPSRDTRVRRAATARSGFRAGADGGAAKPRPRLGAAQPRPPPNGARAV